MAFILGLVALIIISSLSFGYLWKQITALQFQNELSCFFIKGFLYCALVVTMGFFAAVGFMFVFVFLYKTPNS